MNSEQKLYKSRQWLKKKYIDEQLTTREIAEICDVNNVTIFYNLKKFNIKTRRSWTKVGTQFLGFRTLSDIAEALDRLCQKRGESKSEILRKATIEYLIKRGCNPFKEN